MAISDFLEAAALNHFYRGQASPQQATLWVALFTADPTDAGTGAEVSTGVWTNYARASIDVSSAGTIFGAPSGGQVSSGSAVSFGTPTISGTDPVVTHAGIMDASSGGNLWDHAPLTTPKTITNGDPVTIPSGSLTISRD